MENITSNGKTRRASYSHRIMDRKKDQRRLEAEERQAVYDGLTTKQKIDLAISRGGSIKELARLIKQRDNEKKPKIKDLGHSGNTVESIQTAAKHVLTEMERVENKRKKV